MTDETGQLDLAFLIEQHKKEIWAYKKKEMEWIKTNNQLEGNKQIINNLSKKHADDINRLSEENSNISVLNSNIKKELDEVKKDNKRLADQVSTYREILRKAGL
jgi:Mg2+ and Co2+ transporter CorA